MRKDQDRTDRGGEKRMIPVNNALTGLCGPEDVVLAAGT